MRAISETQALEKLRRIQTEFTDHIRHTYEHRAKSCVTCETPGACCLDEHFVNVRITRLESVAIGAAIREMSVEFQSALQDRIESTIRKYNLDSSTDAQATTYACPLFEKGVGCLVHDVAKPMPCIAHACYENENDLPPDDLLFEQERRVSMLNEMTYRQPAMLAPLPIAVAAEMDRNETI